VPPALCRGERLAGLKPGLTSRVKQQRMGIATPEIVFVMRDRLAGSGVTAATALAAVGSVHGGVEIIDSRYHDFRFTLPDVVADNA
jgi:2-oxo-3-hexenedioate decarboxylase